MDKDEQKIKNEILKSLADENVPDLRLKILDALEKRKEEKVPWWKKRGVIFAGTAFASALVVLAFVLPFSLSGISTSSDSQSTSSIPVQPPVLETKHHEIAFGVMAANNSITSSLVSSSFPSNYLKIQRAFDAFDLEDKIRDLNPYMLTAENLLKKNFSITPELSLSGDQEFPYLMQIDDEISEIEFYYRETLVESEDDEEEFHIEGYFFKNSTRYELVGEKELENNEYEISFRLELNDRESLIIQEEHEQEDNEYERAFSYTYLTDNRVDRIVELSYEEEGKEKELEVVIEEQEVITYQIEEITSDNLNIYISSDDEDVMVSLTIEEAFYFYQCSSPVLELRLPRG